MFAYNLKTGLKKNKSEVMEMGRLDCLFERRFVSRSSLDSLLCIHEPCGIGRMFYQ